MNAQSAQFQRVLPNLFDAIHATRSDTQIDPTQRSQAMRLRVFIFSGVFVLCLLASLSYTFMRSAIYMANARIQITPSERVPASKTVAAPDSTQAFLIEVQMINSRPLLEKVVKKLQNQGLLKPIDADPVSTVQDMLMVLPVAGTQIVQLQAKGSDHVLVASLINAVIEAYRDEQAATGNTATQTQLDETREEVQVIEKKVAEKKKTLETFKLNANIVSSERDENQTLSRLKGLGTSLNTATDREATTAGRVRAIEQAITQGRHTPLLKDNPTVTGIESRLSQLKEEWRSLERQFMPQYLDMDANARSLKTRISALEQQLEVERLKGQQTALADAKEELASVQATTQHLHQQLTNDKQDAQTFSRNFSEYQGMREELQGLEQMRQTSKQKLLAMESSEAARRPRIQVIEPAVPPDAPWRPLYWRDAGISLAASLLLGFLAVWFVEFFKRTEPPQPGPSTVIIPPSWMAMTLSHVERLGTGATAQSTPTLTGAQDSQQLPAPLPRELHSDEIENLLEAAAPEEAAILACLLCGLSVDEVVALRQQLVDTNRGTLEVPGESNRVLPLPALLRSLPTPRLSEAPDDFLFLKATGRPLDTEDVHSIVTSSAYDAALTQPQSVTPAALRHTYVAFLVRQGLRLGELSQLVGRLNAQDFHSLAPLMPESQRVSIEQVERLLPVLRTSSAGIHTGCDGQDANVFRDSDQQVSR